jgi:hypothetical protein
MRPEDEREGIARRADGGPAPAGWSALRELRCLASSLETVLLAFLHARVAREELLTLESWLQTII